MNPLLDFLERNKSPICNDIIQECLKEVDYIRQKIILMERTVNLLPILTSPSYPYGIIPQKNEILKYIISPKILLSQEVTPSFLQHSSLFITFIYNRPELFAKVISSRYGSPDFLFIIIL